MRESSLQAEIDAAKTFEALFVPALFRQWAPKVADAAHIQSGQRVLDVACGTGILAREAASRMESTGHVVGIDLSPGMVAVARQLAPTIEWREGMAESLPFPDRSFDAVVSQFGLMFFTDRRQALQEMFRVLAPGGRLAVATWDSLDNMLAYASEVALPEQKWQLSRRSVPTLRRMNEPRSIVSPSRDCEEALALEEWSHWKTVLNGIHEPRFQEPLIAFHHLR